MILIADSHVTVSNIRVSRVRYQIWSYGQGASHTSYLGGQSMEDHDGPRPKEGGGRGVEPAGPVHNEDEEGGLQHFQGQLTEHLGSKVGGEAIGTTGTLLAHYYTLRMNWLGDKALY